MLVVRSAASRSALVALALVGLAGCNGPGYLMALRQDKADRAALQRSLARRAPAQPFAARTLLAQPWTRLWVFSDRATAQGIEDRIGLPFPRTDQPVARGASYLVFADAARVRSAFSVPAEAATSFTCLRARRPYGPAASLVLVAAGRHRAVAVAGREPGCAPG